MEKSQAEIRKMRRLSLRSTSSPVEQQGGNLEEAGGVNYHEVSFVLLWKRARLLSTYFSLGASEWNEQLSVKPQGRCNHKTMGIL